MRKTAYEFCSPVRNSRGYAVARPRQGGTSQSHDAPRPAFFPASAARPATRPAVGRAGGADRGGPDRARAADARLRVNRAQDRVELTAAGAAAEIKQSLGRNLQTCRRCCGTIPRHTSGAAMRPSCCGRGASWCASSVATWPSRSSKGWTRPIGRRSSPRSAATTSMWMPNWPGNSAGRLSGPAYSRSYFVPLPGGLGMELLDVCVPIRDRGGLTGYMIATLLPPGPAERDRRCRRQQGARAGLRRGRRHAAGACRRHRPRPGCVRGATHHRPAGRLLAVARRQRDRRARAHSKSRHGARARAVAGAGRRRGAAGARRAQARRGRARRWRRHWRFARRWKTPSSPACAHAIWRAASRT